jgi:hypothetical protein
MRWLALSLLATSPAVLAGCDPDLSVNVRAGDRPPSPEQVVSTATPEGSAFAATADALGAGISVDRVRLIIRGFRLQANPVADGGPAPDDHEVAGDPVLLDLSGGALAPGAMTELLHDRPLAWRSYYQSVFDLQPVSAGDVASNPDLAPLLGKTFAIEGRLPDGTSFTYASSVSTRVIRPTVFRGGSRHNALTFNVAVNHWFDGGAGLAPLDPLDPASAGTIERNVLDSLDTYMDDDRDGNPDYLG